MIEDFAQDWPAPTSPLPIVLIGAGGIVRDAHLPAYAKAGLTVAAVAEIDSGRRTALARDFAIPQTHATVTEAVAAHGNSVVYDMAVPPVAIVPILRDLPDGAAVLIQKPMGSDLANAREIRAICREKRLKAAVNFQLRFSPMMMAARQAVEAGLIGDKLEIEVHLNIFTPWTLFPFLLPMKRVEILVHSIHYLDSIRAIFGTPKAAFARSMGDPRAPGFAQTRTTAILDWGDLRRGVMSINHNHQGGRKFQSAWFRIEGTKGAMMVKLGVDFDYPHGEADELWFCENGGDWRQVPLTGSWFIEAFMGPMRNLQRFATGEDSELFSGVEDAYETMALVEACFTALETPAVSLDLS
ncbi:Gfo/Idh/MocA family oxidoreductase [Tabrizicola sp.]|jgi:predicted dehydrogenase|uniref:Gfo/Idh/MocA family protein n=1 Tax=Tabrizicola sp. TaxID=2005166 RepID=UPI001A5FE6BF|nr:Gfo/Idh/MocA family oxidoreductase [Tabrizicola sp.]MBL9063776.1 Gfo/Idh/MocA family oxidoreductase [Tabrizicola sp.]